MTLTPMLSWLTQFFVEGSKYLDDTMRIVLAGIFAGTFIGIGVSLTFVGDGSTGGLDVLYFLIYKYLKIKQSISSKFSSLISVPFIVFILSMISLASLEFTTLFSRIFPCLTMVLLYSYLSNQNTNSQIINNSLEIIKQLKKYLRYKT